MRQKKINFVSLCLTIKNYAMSDSFADFVNELETAEQPTCSMENPEECEACGS